MIKSNERLSLTQTGHAPGLCERQAFNRNHGVHAITSSEVKRPIFPKIALNDR